MSHNELMAWERYYQVEPWGQLRDNMHSGMIAAAIVNQHRKRGGKVFTYEDFLMVPVREQRAKNRGKFFTAMRAMAKREGDNG